MEKQELQVGESQWQNSNATTSYNQKQRIEIRFKKDGFKTSSRLIRLKNGRNILG